MEIDVTTIHALLLHEGTRFLEEVIRRIMAEFNLVVPHSAHRQPSYLRDGCCTLLLHFAGSPVY